MSVVRHMLYGPFRTQKPMVTFIFKFGLRKGQCQVKLGQIRSNFQIQNFLTTNAHLVQFCHRIPKMYFVSTYAIKNTKSAFQKVTSSHVPVFYHCATKNKDIALNLVTRIARTQLYNIYYDFRIPSKIYILHA